MWPQGKDSLNTTPSSVWYHNHSLFPAMCGPQNLKSSPSCMLEHSFCMSESLHREGCWMMRRETQTQRKMFRMDSFVMLFFLSHKKVGWTSTLWAADKRATGHVYCFMGAWIYRGVVQYRSLYLVCFLPLMWLSSPCDPVCNLLYQVYSCSLASTGDGGLIINGSGRKN